MGREVACEGVGELAEEVVAEAIVVPTSPIYAYTRDIWFLHL
jgi:hypothetical protein